MTRAQPIRINPQTKVYIEVERNEKYNDASCYNISVQLRVLFSILQFTRNRGNKVSVWPQGYEWLTGWLAAYSLIHDITKAIKLPDRTLQSSRASKANDRRVLQSKKKWMPPKLWNVRSGTTVPNVLCRIIYLSLQYPDRIYHKFRALLRSVDQCLWITCSLTISRLWVEKWVRILGAALFVMNGERKNNKKEKIL